MSAAVFFLAATGLGLRLSGGVGWGEDYMFVLSVRFLILFHFLLLCCSHLSAIVKYKCLTHLGALFSLSVLLANRQRVPVMGEEVSKLITHPNLSILTHVEL